ncbi:MAG: hypothetical protein JW751_15845 [Polyangiaceae bacterium]|nr:hypothetical protein [Polyangiaceae bacterium]
MSTAAHLAPAHGQGWIGQWSPGIGDPTIGGWLTVVLYVVAAVACARVVHARRVRGPRENWFWAGLFMVLVLLGINKQLDLQSAVTEAGRVVFRELDIYAHRRAFQYAFVATAGIATIAGGSGLGWLVRGAPVPTWIALFGMLGLSAFVLVRAISFHHVDALLGLRVGGLALNWVLEMGSLLVVAASAGVRLRLKGRAVLSRVVVNPPQRRQRSGG